MNAQEKDKRLTKTFCEIGKYLDPIVQPYIIMRFEERLRSAEQRGAFVQEKTLLKQKQSELWRERRNNRYFLRWWMYLKWIGIAFHVRNSWIGKWLSIRKFTRRASNAILSDLLCMLSIQLQNHGNQFLNCFLIPERLQHDSTEMKAFFGDEIYMLMYNDILLILKTLGKQLRSSEKPVFLHDGRNEIILEPQSHADTPFLAKLCL